MNGTSISLSFSESNAGYLRTEIFPEWVPKTACESSLFCAIDDFLQRVLYHLKEWTVRYQFRCIRKVPVLLATDAIIWWYWRRTKAILREHHKLASYACALSTWCLSLNVPITLTKIWHTGPKIEINFNTTLLSSYIMYLPKISESNIVVRLKF